MLRFITHTLSMLMTIVILAGGYLAWQYQLFLQRPIILPEQGYTLNVAPGTTLRTLSDQLHREGLLSPGWMFYLQGRLEQKASKIKLGEYQLQGEMKPAELLALLVSGKVVNHAFTIIEGWSFAQLRSAIAQDTRLKQTLTELSDEELMKRIGHPDEHPEGRFLPETYHFTRGMSDQQLLTRAYDAMTKLLEKEWQGRAEDALVTTPYEALILASIVEKETGVASERPEIAGVFTRRLKKGMLLQTDPTIIYGMGEAYDGNIRKRDLQRDTPYNTYTRKGLTPTPIALPGTDAIHAALHPAEGKSLYFVAKGNGTHHFSATLEEHNRAVRKYQLKR